MSLCSNPWLFFFFYSLIWSTLCSFPLLQFVFICLIKEGMICYFLEFHHSCCGVTGDSWMWSFHSQSNDTRDVGRMLDEVKYQTVLVTSHLDWQKRRLMCRDQSSLLPYSVQKRWLEVKRCIINLSSPAQSTDSTPVLIDMLVVSVRFSAPTLLLLQSFKKLKSSSDCSDNLHKNLKLSGRWDESIYNRMQQNFVCANPPRQSCFHLYSLSAGLSCPQPEVSVNRMCTSPASTDEFPSLMQHSDSSPPAAVLTVEVLLTVWQDWLSSPRTDTVNCFVMKGGTVCLYDTETAPMCVS